MVAIAVTLLLDVILLPVFSLSFPCAEDARMKGVANFTLLFNTTNPLPPGSTMSDHLLGKVVTITGKRMCNCTMCTSGTLGGSETEGFLTNTIFYVVAAVVVLVILIVIAVTAFCHCYMVKPVSMKPGSDEEIE